MRENWEYNTTEYIAECERFERFYADNASRLEQIKEEIRTGGSNEK
jgi:hypothetical protein